jgi:hypothetical protein
MFQYMQRPKKQQPGCAMAGLAFVALAQNYAWFEEELLLQRNSCQLARAAYLGDGLGEGLGGTRVTGWVIPGVTGWVTGWVAPGVMG